MIDHVKTLEKWLRDENAANKWGVVHIAIRAVLEERGNLYKSCAALSAESGRLRAALREVHPSHVHQELVEAEARIEAALAESLKITEHGWDVVHGMVKALRGEK